MQPEPTVGGKTSAIDPRRLVDQSLNAQAAPDDYPFGLGQRFTLLEGHQVDLIVCIRPNAVETRSGGLPLAPWLCVLSVRGATPPPATPRRLSPTLPQRSDDPDDLCRRGICHPGCRMSARTCRLSVWRLPRSKRHSRRRARLPLRAVATPQSFPSLPTNVVRFSMSGACIAQVPKLRGSYSSGVRGSSSSRVKLAPPTPARLRIACSSSAAASGCSLSQAFAFSRP